MIETWQQITCDGCGDTHNTEIPDETRKQFREQMKAYGWRQRGSLDYCRLCVKEGKAKRRESVLR